MLSVKTVPLILTFLNHLLVAMSVNYRRQRLLLSITMPNKHLTCQGKDKETKRNGSKMFVKEYVKKEKNIQTEMVTVNANINELSFIKMFMLLQKNVGFKQTLCLEGQTHISIFYLPKRVTVYKCANCSSFKHKGFAKKQLYVEECNTLNSHVQKFDLVSKERSVLCGVKLKENGVVMKLHHVCLIIITLLVQLSSDSSQMEGDSVHATIEKFIKKRDMYAPCDYFSAVRNSKVSDPN